VTSAFSAAHLRAAHDHVVRSGLSAAVEQPRAVEPDTREFDWTFAA
jgi:hypothetical protein